MPLLRSLQTAATIAYGALAADACMSGPVAPARDAGTAHDPANGQFTSGGSGAGSGGAAKPTAAHRAAALSNYHGLRKTAGQLGQAVLDNPSKAGFQKAAEAHRAAANAGRAVPYPGNEDYVSHHVERAASHGKAAHEFGRPSKDEAIDATAHDPSNGQFTSGGGGGGSQIPAAGAAGYGAAPVALGMQPSNSESYGRLRLKGYSDGEITDIWEWDRKNGGGTKDEQSALITQSSSGIPGYAGRVLEVNKGGNIPPSIESAVMGRWPGRSLD